MPDDWVRRRSAEERARPERLRLLCWNTHSHFPQDIVESEGADLALLQECPPLKGRTTLDVFPAAEPWSTSGGRRPWRTAIVRTSDRVSIDELRFLPFGEAQTGSFTVSQPGTLTAARVVVDGDPVLTAVSVYAPWEKYPSGQIWADGSAHRILSDLSPLLWSGRKEPIIVAGDFNMLFGYGEHGNRGAARRYIEFFQRAESLGLTLVGPFAPFGRQADPWPNELPAESRCVPTFHHSRQNPASASRQLDFVFASAAVAERVHVAALNDPEVWGPSDHCRLLIDVDLP